MNILSKLEVYHVVWLEAHRDRSAKWLLKMLKNGFDIHHLDGNHDNNDPTNLVLIEHIDHMNLHKGVGNRLIRNPGPLFKRGKIKPPKERRLIPEAPSGLASKTNLWDCYPSFWP